MSDTCGSLVGSGAGARTSSNSGPPDEAAPSGGAASEGVPSGGPASEGAASGIDGAGAPHGEPYAAVLESHLSVVLLIGALALKFKKPARLPFVDLSTRSARRDICLAELDLNRRLTPDVYLGVAELTAPTVPEVAGEPVLVMRRLPDAFRMTRLLVGGADLRPALTDVARQLVALHTAQRPEFRTRLLANTRRLWSEGRDQLRRFEPEVLAGEDVDEVAALADEYLTGRAWLLNDRERRGLVRDGHGDLLADDLFCLPDGVRILDCLEFDRSLRVNDVLADVAFLAMDLRLRGAPEQARFFVDRYREHSAENHPLSLEQHYVAYRAFVRAKVECLRHEQGDPEAAGRARQLLALALAQLRAARVRLVLIGGLPGSGKSTLAAELAASGPEAPEWMLLSSDAVRRDLCAGSASAGAGAFGTGNYDPAGTAATYTELLRRAELALAAGRSVLLDASWTSAAQRPAARELARRSAAVLTEVRCDLPLAACVLRLVARRDPHGSDADPGVLERMAELAEPWPQAYAVRTDGPVAATVRVVQELLDRAPVDPAGAGREESADGSAGGR